MKIRIVAPIIKADWLFEAVKKDAEQFKAPDTEIDVVGLDKGPASIEGYYDEVLAASDVADKVVQAEADGCDGVFVTCFGDPGVDAAREMVSIPVVGGFQPAVLAASALCDRWSVVTVLKSVIPLIVNLARKMGLEARCISIRDIDTPVLELDKPDVLLARLQEQSERAITEDGAEAIIFGCTGMLGVGRALAEALKKKGFWVPVVEPTAASIGFLESMIRSGLAHSKLTYPVPREKERVS